MEFNLGCVGFPTQAKRRLEWATVLFWVSAFTGLGILLTLGFGIFRLEVPPLTSSGIYSLRLCGAGRGTCREKGLRRWSLWGDMRL